MNQCKTCEMFKRQKWHKVIDEEESYQLGGYCELLLKVLKITNSDLFFKENLYVQESFGCVFHTEKRLKW